MQAALFNFGVDDAPNRRPLKVPAHRLPNKAFARYGIDGVRLFHVLSLPHDLNSGLFTKFLLVLLTSNFARQSSLRQIGKLRLAVNQFPTG